MFSGSRNGKRFGPRTALDQALDSDGAAADDSIPRGGNDHLLLVDDQAWERAGRELRQRDPHRFIAILKVVEDICSIYRDPLGDKVAQGHFIFARTEDGDFD